MPKGLREIRNRIKSVKSTGQITRAMQLVASSKMKRAQDSARAGRAYAEHQVQLEANRKAREERDAERALEAQRAALPRWSSH